MKNYIIALLWFSLTCAACYNTKKAERQTHKALIEYPEVVAKVARTAFPCILKKSDTTITNIDTVIVINCPEFTIKDSINIHDTIRINRTVKVPIKLPVRTIINTIEDSAKIELLLSYVESQNLEVEELSKINAAGIVQSSISAKKIAAKNKIIFILSLLITIPILIFFLKALYKLR